MLLIQDIGLSWGKIERGSACARMRAEFPAAYSMERFPDVFSGEVLVHCLKFLQRGTTFQALQIRDAYHYQSYASVHDLNLTNLSVRVDTECYEVDFFYDQQRSGRPVRQGHNKDYHKIDSLLYRHDILNETAFCLGPGQYGRIHWNERNIDYDTGEWYYQWHIVNLLHVSEKMPKADLFVTQEPDFEYQQMAVLL